MLSYLRTSWKSFLAFWRLDLAAVCEMSKNGKQYHDYPDDPDGTPDHFVELTCER